ncbi:unknown protein [Spodoptera frugiperda multiple nucleopolyhedrovirus]|uniref:Sf107 n=1 Tax=Spodoptera frugiperda nuclear polyhedrosis virus TaxID=10455 RepID=A1YJ97_NPVSF|nr:hypothetical protein SFMNPV_gp107 [Spodoptera frugiperda multiple nucleopolyhedrovirus]ABM45817.1 unknown protein [Spodoptera frugiperda multiple nucleopolyhedrovirus]ACA02664.1 unknown [Spodoptera frugiperda multiple nucleopolyhedrovirus]ADV91339.1 hypothetical protein Sf107 [Spodoptera frugiperda multiple nucleopolyhedrovirus]AFH59049.1 hypothetical protein Sf107 [Spodoptera frugiperda multiple nucleopolyhedrovirus]AIW01517.1 hypothetical protein [Spodoptera frugiperda multiple nucleopoly
MDTEDIFDKFKIKMLSYDSYSKLGRYVFMRQENNDFLYLDKYTDKVQKFSHRFQTLTDLGDYLILVY